MRVYPSDDSWGNRTLRAFARRHGEGDERQCQVITLMDVWTLDHRSLAGMRLASWCPVDHDPIPPLTVAYFELSGARPIAMSRFGEDRMRRVGLDPLYVPHAVDTSVFRPREDERLDVRDALGVPADAFVVGMVAANKGSAVPRKSFPWVFQAFARFHERHPEAILYLHCEKLGHYDGINMEALAIACGVPLEALRFTDQVEMQVGIAGESLAYLYSLMDVLCSPSMGEGFGIPIIEAQACGVPVIVSDWTSMPELVGAGWKVGGQRHYNAGQGSWFLTPSVQEIEEALERAHAEAAGLRTKAARFAQVYSVERVLEKFWKPVLASLERGRQEVEPLPDRSYRRKPYIVGETEPERMIAGERR